jgi:uncharacterized protein YndB with AHSA1/START domain
MGADFSHSLERAIDICARRDTVFRFFTDSKYFADWWGEGSTIEGRKSGSLKILFSNGIQVSGKILEIDPPERIVFTYGYESGKPFSPEDSRVTITLQEHPSGTRLTLTHEFHDAASRDQHIQAWRYQLALFANAASKTEHADVQKWVDSYFELWSEKDSVKRLKEMKDLMVPELTFQDKHSCTLGLEDLNAHLTAYQMFMPGMRLSRDGDIQYCQGTVAVRWIAKKEDGAIVAKGLNVFRLSPEGRIRHITGFWE